MRRQAQQWRPDDGQWKYHRMISVTGYEKGLYVKKVPFLMVARPEWYGLHRRLFFYTPDGIWKPMFGQDLLFTTPGTFQTYTSKSDWNNGRNTVECVGPGGAGAEGASTTTGGGGGGGGAYNRINNYVFTTPGTTNAGYNPGAGGIWGSSVAMTNPTRTWWGSTTQTTYPTAGSTAVGADFGQNPGNSTTNGASATGGTGGSTANNFPNTSVYSFKGGTGGTAVSNSAGGGGGGSAGPRGVGNNGSTTNGGGADGSTLGGGTTGATGTAGTQPFDDWTSTNAVAGGGGSGTSAGTGAAGTAYGGGAGGAGRSTGVAGTPGGQGLVVAQWFPVVQFYGQFDNPDMFTIITRNVGW